MEYRLSPNFALTAKQAEVRDLLTNSCRHNLIYGGGRSGKTFLIILLILLRAMKEPKSTHLIARKTFQHAKGSLWTKTFGDVIDICFPDLKPYIKENKDLWYKELPNGSRLWFGGLDDKDRVDKILGNEYSSIYLNECSEIAWDTVNTVRSRLAERNGLVNKIYYDCNPTASNHWSYQLFINKVQPDTGKELNNADSYQHTRMNPVDNLDNIDDEYIEDLENSKEETRRRFLLGEFSTDTEVAVFKNEWLRFYHQLPSINYVVCSWDTSFKTKDYNDPSACTVWVVCEDGYYLLDIINERLDYPSLKRKIIDVAERYRADTVLIEDAASGQSLLQDLQITSRIPLVGCRVGRQSKVERAQYAASLFEAGKVQLPLGHDLIDEYKSQLLMFPLSLHDDMVDSTSHFMNYARENLMYELPDSVYGVDDDSEEVYMGSDDTRNAVTGY